jgi:hypothetical protein
MSNNKFKVDATMLRSGVWVARPRGALGNVGWHPFAWEAVTAQSRQNAISKFTYIYREQIAALGGDVPTYPSAQ